MLPFLYLRDSCDRIGMRVHQSSVRYTVHQPALKTHFNTRMSLVSKTALLFKKQTKNICSPLFGTSHSKSWSCTWWHFAKRATTLHHGRSRGHPWARTFCAHRRWSPCRPQMASRRACQRMNRTLWGRQTGPSLQNLLKLLIFYALITLVCVFLLGICFFQQGNPKLITPLGMHRQ